MNDVDQLSKPKTDIDPASSTHTEEGAKYAPELTRKTALSGMSGYRRQTPTQLLMFQRVIGNRATQKLIQRDVEKIDDIPGEMEKWPHDLGSLISKYPVAEAALSFYEKPPGSLLEKLRHAVILHANAAKITAILQKATDEERGAWLNKIQDSKGSIGLSEGTLFQENDAQMMALMPDYATDYFQRVMTMAGEKWGSLSEDNQKDLVEQVFNQTKGYDWAVIDIEKWKPASERKADLAKLINEGLQGTSNNDPFTLKSLHIDNIGEHLKANYAKHEDAAENVAGFFLGKLGNSVGYKGLQAMIKGDEKGIKKALVGYITESGANAVYDELISMTEGY